MDQDAGLDGCGWCAVRAHEGAGRALAPLDCEVYGGNYGAKHGWRPILSRIQRSRLMIAGASTGDLRPDSSVSCRFGNTPGALDQPLGEVAHGGDRGL